MSNILYFIPGTGTGIGIPILTSIKQFLDYGIVFFSLFAMLSKVRKTDFFSFLIIALVYWVIYYFHRYGHTHVSPAILVILELAVFGLFTKSEMLRIFKIYRSFMVWLSLLGVIGYLAFFLYPGLPHTVTSYYSDIRKGLDINFYYNYYFSIVLLTQEGVRLCGLFDEPGRFGTVLALLLIADNLNLKRWGNIVLFVAMLFTLSLAAVLIVALYACLVSVKNIRVGILLIVLGFLFYYVLPDIMSQDEGFNVLLERMQVEDGKMAGDNRMNDNVENFMQKQMSSVSTALFGYGTGALVHFDFRNLSFLFYVFEYGIIGCFVMFFPVLLLAFRYCKRNFIALMYLLCFVVSLYQRPHLFTAYYFLLLFGGIVYVLNREVYAKEKSIK